MKPRTWVLVLLVLSFLGVADASYLAQHAVTGTPLLCDVQNISGCNAVATSPYSRIFGVPIAVYGVIFYGLVFVLSALELVIYDQLLRRILQGIAGLGFIASLYFILVQFFLIGAFCIYCLLSAIIAVVMLACATRIEPLPSLRQGGALVRKTLPKPGSRVPFAPGQRPERKDLPLPPLS